MALSKIRLANKKAKREIRRRRLQAQKAGLRRQDRIRQKRTKKMLIEGRREYHRQRAKDLAYVKQLEGEIGSEENR